MFVAVPAILYCAWNAYEKEKDHAAHGRADFIPYAHMRVRNKVAISFSLTIWIFT